MKDKKEVDRDKKTKEKDHNLQKAVPHHPAHLVLQAHLNLKVKKNSIQIIEIKILQIKKKN